MCFAQLSGMRCIVGYRAANNVVWLRRGKRAFTAPATPRLTSAGTSAGPYPALCTHRRVIVIRNIFLGIDF
jgi:hypothetical protein